MKTKCTYLALAFSILLLSGFAFNSIVKPGRNHAQKLLNNNPLDYGYTSGNFTVTDNGAAVYEIPLLTSPGTAGMSPKLSLTYSSQSGNGLLGEGWNLNGLSIISRGPASMSIDGIVDPIDFDQDDRFFLDGKRLVLFNPGPGVKYGDNLTEYRTEKNSFTKVKAYSDGTTQSFEAYTKDGLIYHYGKRVGSNSQVLASGLVNQYLHWLVDRIEDRNGNYILINYDTFANESEYRPKSIEYTGNSITGLQPYNLIEFLYKNRSDLQTKYLAGSKSSITKLLDVVNVYHSNSIASNKDSLVRHYKFTYSPDPNNGKAYLQKFTECAGDSINRKCLDPIEFDWSKSSKISFSKPKVKVFKKAFEEQTQIHFGDINNDGFQDKIAIENNGKRVSINYFLNDGQGVFAQPVALPPISVSNSLYAQLYIGDGDADGDADIFLSWLNKSKWYIQKIENISDESNVKFKIKNQYSTAAKSVSANLKTRPQEQILFSDLNGDALLDFIMFDYTKRNILIHKVLTNPDKTFKDMNVDKIAKGEIPDFSFPKIVDLNQDGISDFLFVWTNDKGLYNASIINDVKKKGGANFSYIKIDANQTSTYIEKSRFIDIRVDTTETDPIITTTGVTTLIKKGNLSDMKNISMGDVNDDGVPDIILSNTSKTGWIVYTYLGDGTGRFLKEKKVQLIRKKFNTDWNLTMGEFNGDGLTDLLIYKTSSNGLTTHLANGTSDGSFKTASNSNNIKLKAKFSYSKREDLANILPAEARNFDQWHQMNNKELAKQLGAKNVNISSKNTKQIYDYLIKDYKNRSFNTGYFPNRQLSAFPKGMHDKKNGGQLLANSINRFGSVKQIESLKVMTSNVEKIMGHKKPPYPGEYNSMSIKKLNYITDINISIAYFQRIIDHAEINFSNFWNLYATDLNGDGISDLMLTYPRHPDNYDGSRNGLQGNHRHYVWMNNSDKAGLVNTITEGNGNEVKIQYSPITEEETYNVEGTYNYPIGVIKAPIYVVNETKSDNGVGGYSRMKYKYIDAIMHYKDRGFQGFKKVIKKHLDTKITEETTYFTDYNRDKRILDHGIRLVESTRKYHEDTSGLSIIEETKNSDGILINGPVFMPYIKRTEEKKYDLNVKNRLLVHRNSSFQFDRYGNQLFSRVDHIDPTSGLTTFIERTENSYSNNLTNWILGRLDTTAVIKSDGITSDKSVVKFMYDSKTGQLSNEKFIAEDVLLQLEKSYEFDIYGNIIRSHTDGFVDALTHQRRTTETVYDPKGRFVIKTIDPMGYATSSSQHQSYGYGDSSTDVNGNVSTTAYDVFGNKLRSTDVIGNWSKTYLRKCSSCSYSKATQFKLELYKLGPPVITYFDKHSRKIAQESFDHKGRMIITEQEYDHLGQLTSKTTPYFSGDSTQQITFQYDKFGRLKQSNYPNGSNERIEYHGLNLHKFDKVGREFREIKNDRGQTLRNLQQSTGDPRDYVDYKYDLRGNLLEIVDGQGGNTVRQEFDRNNNRIKVHNPNLSNPYVNRYNGFGELVTEISPGGSSTIYLYDKLGRLTERKDPNGATTKWDYIDFVDPALGKGQVATVTSSDCYVFDESYDYDSYGRIRGHSYHDAKYGRYTYQYSYDATTGLLDKEIIPTTLSNTEIHREYVDGHLVAIKDKNKNLYWQLDETDHLGQITSYILGNGLTYSSTFDRVTNNLTDLKYIDASGSRYLHYSYQYDDLDNIIDKKDVLVPGLSEAFGYDIYDRLYQSTSKSGGISETHTITYDKWHNIKSKSRNGTLYYNYDYHGGSKLKSVNGTSIKYDQEGNRLNGLDYTISYNHLNKPTEIKSGKNKILNAYNYAGVKQLETTKHRYYKKDKLSIGGSFEQIYEDRGPFHKNKLKTERVYINVNGQAIAHVDLTPEKKTVKRKITYNHYDLHGSIVLNTKEDGSKGASKNYDAWGNERNSYTWFAFNPEPKKKIDKRSEYRFQPTIGYQSHDMISAVGLINMGGRIYDPVLSQFLSIDPAVQIGASIGINAYAYVMNNPLKYIDPSGYFLKKLFKGIGSVFKGIGKAIGGALKSIAKFIDKNILIIATIAVGIATGGAALAALGMTLASGGIAAAVVSSAAFGFGSAFSGALFSGASFGEALAAGFTSGVISGVTAAFTFGVGSAFGTGLSTGMKIAKAGAHGIVQGTFQMMQGGKFQHGFLSGMFAELATPLGESIDSSDGFSFKRVATASMVGGTASAIGGGKFANGAISGAMVQAFNGEGHRSKAKEILEMERREELMNDPYASGRAEPVFPELLGGLAKGAAKLGQVIGKNVRIIGGKGLILLRQTPNGQYKYRFQLHSHPLSRNPNINTPILHLNYGPKGSGHLMLNNPSLWKHFPQHTPALPTSPIIIPYRE